MADVLLKDASGDDIPYEGVETISLRSTDGQTTETFVSERLIQNQMQADWAETDTTSPAYIKNKPEAFEGEKELPDVTTDDNGKVLGVVDGVWSKMENTGGGEAVTELPEVSTTDNGKILGVVDGLWSKMDAPKTEDELPTVSTTDNGKVLGVIGGAWSSMELPEVEDELPEVTAIDDGKFLGVVGGAWAKTELPEVEDELPQTTIDDNGRVLGIVDGAWDIMDLPEPPLIGEVDRSFSFEWSAETTPTTTFNFNSNGANFTAYKVADYAPTREQVLSGKWAITDVNSETVAVFPTQSLVFTQGNLETGSQWVNAENAIIFNADKIYRVYWNGKIYWRRAYRYTEDTIHIGNLEGGDPFTLVYAIDASGGTNWFLTSQPEGVYTIGIEAPSTVSDMVISEEDIMVTDENILVIGFPLVGYAFAVAYNAGDVTTVFNGQEISFTIPEAGFYQLLASEQPFPTNLIGTYSGVEEVQVDFAQADYNELDTEQRAYIKNRPFYTEPAVKEIIPTTTFQFMYDNSEKAFMSQTQSTPEQLDLWFNNWDIAKVVWDNTEYLCKPITMMGMKAIGNVGFLDPTYGATEEPFIIGLLSAESIFGQDVCFILDLSIFPTEETQVGDSVNHVFGLSIFSEEVKKLDVKYLPDSCILPAVTATDNGKILEVKDGVWTMVSVEESSIATYIKNYVNSILGTN